MYGPQAKLYRLRSNIKVISILPFHSNSLLSENPFSISVNRFSPKTRSPIVEICLRMGQPVTIVPDWVVVDNKHTPPEKEAFPKPEKRSDGSYIYERIPSVGGDNVNSNRQQMLYKKRAYDERPPEPPVPSKVGKQQPKGRGYSVNQVTPKGASKFKFNI